MWRIRHMLPIRVLRFLGPRALQRERELQEEAVAMRGARRNFGTLMLGVALLIATGCAPFRVPAIDPTGSHIFSGQTTEVDPAACHDLVPRPAFPNVAAPPPCPAGGAPPCGSAPGAVLPAAQLRDQSYVVMMPGRVVAPVGSEVIVVSGICGESGHYVMRQPLEWMMSPDSVGHIMQVGNNRWHFLTDWLSSGNAQKLDLDWAKNRTHSHRQTVTRGTPAPNDDVVLGKGQSWVSVMSPTEGASFVTVMAPGEENWDRRRQTATIYWVDAQWTLPPPLIARVDRREPALLTTTLQRSQGIGPIEGWLVRYEAIDGPLALFENGQRVIEIPTDINGQATARLTPQNGEGGITQVAVQIVRPASSNGEVPRMVVGQGLTSVTWSAPGLAVRASGPATADAEKPVTYRVEVSNTGDIPAPNVVLAYALPEGATLVGTNPPAQPFGNRLEWRLGDLPARSPPQAVEVTVAMRLQARYDHRFRATSMRGAEPVPELSAEGVASTIVNRSALVVRMRGPKTAPVGGQATFLVEVENVSSLPATNVTLTDTFDPGLQHVSGQPSPLISSAIGTLGPGEKEAIALNFIVTQPGQHCHRLDVTADGDVRATVQDCVTATGELPVARVGIRMTGPERLNVGETGLYEIEVRNTGTQPLTNLRISNRYSTSLRPAGASSNYELGRGEIAWKLPELAAGDAIRWQFQGLALRPDPSARSVSTVVADGGLVQSAEVTTQIVGGAGGDAVPAPAPPVQPPPATDTRPVPAPQPQPPAAQGALQVEIEDSDDPVVVGKEYTYRITLTNTSDQPDQAIGLTLEKPAELRFIRIVGDPRGARVEATRIVLPTIAELRGREGVRPFELRVVAEKPGTFQLKAQARSARVPQGVVETEETRVVAE
jgi:uncharacterized repeat protein (TIGR01451 family)